MYTGEGQEGDMAFQRGNKAIRDHAELGRELLLFAALGKGQPVRFEGEFSCASWEIREGDGKGNLRKTIVFHLFPNESAIGISGIKESQQAYTAHVSFDEQRRRAYAAAKPQRSADVQYSLQAYRQRSDDIKGYVLARSGGICEACGQPAPFRGIDGRPYLEAHHTHRLADGGLDDPRNVAAICANCHRRCHFGQDALQWNQALIEKIQLKEKS